MEEIETVGLGLFWEEQTVGRRFKTVGRTVSETDLINFVSLTGMTEGLFTDVEYIKKASLIKGGRLIPAALTFGFAEGLVIQGMLQGVGMAFLNMEQNVKGPTFVGDTIHVVGEVIECKPSKGQPGLGLVRTRNEVIKQDGTVVMVYTPLRLIRGRNYQPA